MRRRALLLFLKYPAPGRVKTRLAATVGAEAAAEIYCQLVAEVVSRLPSDVELVALFDPPERRTEIEAWMRALKPDGAWRFEAQTPGDLGQRLTAAFADAFARGAGPVGVLGTDCIDLDPALFAELWSALETADVALGPSYDGGYYLLGLQAPAPELFVEIDWSTERVADQTRQRAAAAGRSVAMLPTRHDVDTEEDWRRVRSRLTLEASARP